MIINPLFQRESRVRWRTWRAFALIFAYVMPLVVVMTWTYLTSMSGVLHEDGSMSSAGSEYWL